MGSFLKYLEGLPPLHGCGTPFIRRPLLRALKGNITIVQNAIFPSKTSNRMSVLGENWHLSNQPKSIFRFCRIWINIDELRLVDTITYPFISHFSFSNPLCIDCDIELSIKSTYLTTCGANRSRRCWWNLPFFKLSDRKKVQWMGVYIHCLDSYSVSHCIKMTNIFVPSVLR